MLLDFISKLFANESEIENKKPNLITPETSARQSIPETTKEEPYVTNTISITSETEDVKAATRDGIERAKRKTPSEYMTEGLAFIESYMRTHPVATSTELLAAWRMSGSNQAQRDSRNIWGAVINVAAKQKLIKKAGRVINTHKHSHNTYATQWISGLIENAEQHATAIDDSTMQTITITTESTKPTLEQLASVIIPAGEEEQHLDELFNSLESGELNATDALLRAYTLGALSETRIS